jgi:hypothetical protein
MNTTYSVSLYDQAVRADYFMFAGDFSMPVLVRSSSKDAMDIWVTRLAICKGTMSIGNMSASLFRSIYKVASRQMVGQRQVT